MLFGNLTLFMSVVTDGFNGLVQAAPKCSLTALVRKNCVYFLLTLPIFIALAMLKDLKEIAKYSFVGLLGACMQVIGVCVGSVMHWMSTERCGEVPTSHCRWYSAEPPKNADGSSPSFWGVLGVALSVFIFGFAVLVALPSVRSQMARPQDMPRVSRVSMSIVVLCYEVVMMLAYASFGQDVTENILQGMAETQALVATIPAIALLLNLAVTIPIIEFCFFTALETKLPEALKIPLSRGNIAFRVATLVGAALLGWVFPYMIALAGVVSSVFCICNNVFFPLLFFYQLKLKGLRVAEMPRWRSVLHGLITIFGVYTMIFGFSGSIDSFKAAISRQPCPSPAEAVTE